MAEDGMLINFDLGNEPLRLERTFKGGRWKDRLSAKKAAQHFRTKAAGNRVPQRLPSGQAGRQNAPNETLNLAVGRGNDFNAAPPAKRQRLEGQDALSIKPSGNNDTDRQHRSSSDNKSKKKTSQQIVSSLFSFNPKSTTTEEEQPEQEDSKPVEPSNAPLASELETFTLTGLSNQLAAHLFSKMDIKAPTGIQRAAVSQLLKEDSDAFLQAETGSGKTLAYLLPIVQRLMSLPATTVQRNSGLFAIVLAPTRELSKQISVVLESLLRCAHWIVSGTVIGGEKKKSEKARLRKGLNILIATPGRLVDHLDNTEVLDVSNVRWLVLDEGDRLMDLGFEEDLKKILSKLDFAGVKAQDIPGLSRKRTNILCSATMKTNVQVLGDLSLKDAVHIHVSNAEKNSSEIQKKEDSFAAPAQLQQSFAIVPAKLRLVSLTAVLKRAFSRKGSVMKTIVFMSCADTVDFHFEVFTRAGEGDEHDDEDAAPSQLLNGKGKDAEQHEKSKDRKKSKKDDHRQEAKSTTFKTGAPATAFGVEDNKAQVFRLHGSLPQAVRTSTLLSFNRCKDAAVLVCTDVAARGLDLPNVDFVIEYDPPFNKDDHLHRIGRTARAGKDGRAMIFLLPGSEEGYIPILKASRHDEGRNVARHDSSELLMKGFGSPGLGAGKDWEVRATDWQLEVERWALENPQALEQARRAFQSHVRAYATHVAAERHIFDMGDLHLGHLAKAFALRDRPGNIKVPGLRPSKKSVGEMNAERRANQNPKSTVAAHQDEFSSAAAAAAEKMRAVLKQQSKMGSGASEFNLG